MQTGLSGAETVALVSAVNMLGRLARDLPAASPVRIGLDVRRPMVRTLSRSGVQLPPRPRRGQEARALD